MFEELKGAFFDLVIITIICCAGVLTTSSILMWFWIMWVECVGEEVVEFYDVSAHHEKIKNSIRSCKLEIHINHCFNLIKDFEEICFDDDLINELWEEFYEVKIKIGIIE